MVFLFKEEIWPEIKSDDPTAEATLPEFFAWNYGPFSTDLLNDLEFLINRGFIEVQYGDHVTNQELAEYEYWLDNSGQASSSEYIEEVFSLSPQGIDKALPLWQELSPNQQKLITDFRTIMIKVSLSKILEYVYKKYEKEGYIDRSLIRERFLRS